MSQSIGDLVVNVLLEIGDVQKDTKVVSKELKTIEDQSKKTEKATKDLSAAAQSAGKGLSFMGLGVAGAVAGLSLFFQQAIRSGAQLSVLRDNFQGTAQDLELFRKATAGTVSEAGLIKLSNQASDLGVSLRDQALLFSLAEDAGDKYGGSLEENFQRVVLATDGSARGLRAVGIATKEFEEKMKTLIATTGKKLDQMSAEEQMQLRLQAIFELTGTTLDTVNQKTVDAADSLEQLGLVAETAASAFGSGLVNAMRAVNQEAGDMSNQLLTVDKTMTALGQSVGLYFSFLLKEIQAVASFLDTAFLEKLRQYGILKAVVDEGLASPMSGNPLGKDTSTYTAPTGKGTRTSRGSTSADTPEKVEDLLKGTLGFSLENSAIAIGKLLGNALFKVTGEAQNLPGYTRGEDNPIEQAGESFKLNLQSAVGDVQNIANILGVGGESFFNSINNAVSLLNSILGLVSAFGGGFGGILSFLGIGGLSSGPAGLTAKLGGSNIQGGTSQVPYIVSTKVKGSDLQLVLARANNTSGRLSQ